MRFVTDEADAVLAIAGAPHPSDADWARLHAAEGYVRLKEREAQFQRAFTDDEFAAFVRGDALRGRLAALRETVDAWRTADISRAETKALAYLPSGAGLRATVYIEIKPRANSFVFQLDSPNPGSSSTSTRPKRALNSRTPLRTSSFTSAMPRTARTRPQR